VVPSGADVVDGTGQCVVPGFIDNHMHTLGGGGEVGRRRADRACTPRSSSRAGSPAASACSAPTASVAVSRTCTPTRSGSARKAWAPTC
jgi:imidazolonepropionase-like amidohydrolase